MYARAIARPKPRKSELKSYPAPIGGWISNRSLALPAGSPGAAVLDNYFPRSGTVKLRRGKQLHATLVDITKPVTALFSYRNGSNERLFASNENVIYEITSVPSPFSGEIVTEDDALIVTELDDWFGFSSTAGFEAMEGLTGGEWSVVQFATTGGVFLVGVNGEDEGFIFDGDYFWPNMPGGVSRLAFDAEGPEFVAGEIVTGGTSGASGTIYRVVPPETDTGYFMLYNVSGAFIDNEPLTGSVAGVATADGTQIPFTSGIVFGSSGLTTADMAFVWVYKNRLWFIQKESLVAWYMEDADAIGGNAVAFPLAGVLGLGGSLMFGQSWSLGTSDQGGLGEQNVLVSTQGEAAVFQGVDPAEAATWSRVGVYRIGTPLGRKAFLRGGGDLAIATSVGLVPLSKAIELDVTSLNIATVSYPIADAWDTATGLRGMTGWQCQLWPEQKMAIVSPPDIIGASEPVLFVSNTETGAWCRFTGWYVTCMEVFRGQLFFGSTGGEVWTANVSGLDGRDTYSGTVIPLFEDAGTPASLKIAKISRPVSRANGVVNAICSVNFDYNQSSPAAPNATVLSDGNLWGVGIWGQSVWGQGVPTVINQGWFSAGGSGYAMAPVYQVTSGSVQPLDDELIRIDLTYTTAAVVS